MPTLWRFSDGTVAHLGGIIEGASLFAQELREGVADNPHVCIRPLPSKSLPVDPNDLMMFDAWLCARMIAPHYRHLKLSIAERPQNIPPLPKAPRQRKGVIY